MKLCVPSYLMPGTWMENLEALGDSEWVDGVELLFFAYDAEARAILDRERGGIAALSDRFELSLHLPDPLSADDEELVAATRDFVSLYVLHPPGGDIAPAKAEAWPSLVESWRARYGDDFLLEYTGAAAFAAAEAALPGLPLCADTGCLLREGLSPAAWSASRSGRIREFHLHGLADGRDHAAPRGDEGWLVELSAFLESYDGRVELEVFSREGVDAARAALSRSLAQARAQVLALAAARAAEARP